MIPIQLYTEPINFDSLVRKKGMAFLSNSPNPTQIEWNKHAYWQVILPDMRRIYNGICNYCATWIPHSTGQHSIDHFLHKNANPPQAYEWKNFRYASSRFNSRKGTKTILDPAGLPIETYIINMSNFHIEVNPNLTDLSLISIAESTCRILKFNVDDALVNERANYFFGYQNGDFKFDYLQSQAPFLAYEINRQGLKI